MAIRFPTEMKMGSKNCNIPIFIYSKIEKKQFNAVRVYFVHSIFNSIFWLKIDFYPNFQFNLICHFLMRFWILKNKSIMEI